MKNINRIALCLALFGFTSFLVAQEYVNRQPTAQERARVSGLSDFAESRWDREHTVTFVNTNSQPVYSATNPSLYSLFVMAPTNPAVSAAWTLSLPNPTNYPQAVLTVHTPGNCQIILSNGWASGGANGLLNLSSYTVSNKMYAVTSNKQATLFSTGTNYWVFVK